MAKEKHKSKKSRARKGIDLEEMNIILRIPKDAAAVTVEAVILNEDGSRQKAAKYLSISDIHTARQDFLDNVDGGDDYDAKFVITDAGREYLENIQQRERQQEPQSWR